METVRVNASKKYDIMIGSGLINDCGKLISERMRSKHCAIVTDDNVDRYYGEKAVKSLEKEGFSVVKFVFPHGEASKSHTTLLRLYDFLADNSFTRSDFLIALGGGVVGDLTGFAAATYMRGIEFVQIPTTVLSQVDSSVGGKTAVDIAGGKNLVGAFHQPSLVICDVDTLNTLTHEFFADGMGEVVKYGMIKSKELFDILCDNDIKSNMTDIIKRCVSIKADVVANDEFDHGERALLNFGHTLGHAIEKYYDFSGISHGYGVAIGMSTFTHIAEAKGMCATGIAEKLDALLIKCALPCSTDIDMAILYKNSLGDKKRNSDGIDIIICSDIGESSVVKMTLDEYADFLGIN